MGNVKISELPYASKIDDDALVVLVQDHANKVVTVDELSQKINEKQNHTIDHLWHELRRATGMETVRAISNTVSNHEYRIDGIEKLNGKQDRQLASLTNAMREISARQHSHHDDINILQTGVKENRRSLAYLNFRVDGVIDDTYTYFNNISQIQANLAAAIQKHETDLSYTYEYITAGIDTKIADLQHQLNEEATARGNMDANLYGEAIPEAGPVNTIKKNADAIATLNGADDVDGSVAQKIKSLKEELDAEVEYKDANSLVKVAISQVDGVVAAKENAVTVKTATLTSGVDQDAEYTLAAPSDSGYTKAGGYKAKSITQIAADDPSLVTSQDAWIYGQCIKTQAINAINSDDNEYIKIVREDNKTKIKFEPWAEVHTITELADVDKI